MTTTRAADLDISTGRVVIGPTAPDRTILEFGPGHSHAELLHLLTQRGYRAVSMAVALRPESSVVRVRVEVPAADAQDDPDAFEINPDRYMARLHADARADQIARLEAIAARRIADLDSMRGDLAQAMEAQVTRIAVLERALAETAKSRDVEAARDGATIAGLVRDVAELQQRNEELERAAHVRDGELIEARRRLRAIHDLTS